MAVRSHNRRRPLRRASGQPPEPRGHILDHRNNAEQDPHVETAPAGRPQAKTPTHPGAHRRNARKATPTNPWPCRPRTPRPPASARRPTAKPNDTPSISDTATPAPFPPPPLRTTSAKRRTNPTFCLPHATPVFAKPALRASPGVRRGGPPYPPGRTTVAPGCRFRETGLQVSRNLHCPGAASPAFQPAAGPFSRKRGAAAGGACGGGVSGGCCRGRAAGRYLGSGHRKQGRGWFTCQDGQRHE